MKYAFIDGDSVVIQVIAGALNPSQQDQFLDDYSKLFGAVAVLDVPDGVDAWIGGRYDDEAGFLPPAPQPQPDPLPEPEPGVEPVV